MEILLLILSSLVLMPLFLVFKFITPFAIYYRVRRKGYSPIATGLIYILFLVFFFFVTLIPYQLLARIKNEVLQLLAFVLLPLLSYFLMIFLAGRVPFFKRKSRPHLYHWGKNKAGLIGMLSVAVEYHKLRVVFILMLIAIAFSFTWGAKEKLGYAGVINNVILSSGFVVLLCITLKNKVVDTIERKKKDRDFDVLRGRYVLYLRSFNTEIDTFSILPNNKRASFENFFAPVTKKEIGHFVALGSPLDSWLDNFMWRSTDVVVREYFDDSNWKENLEIKLKYSTCIFLHVGVTQNIDFELSEIFNKGYSSKLFIFTKPRIASVPSIFIRFFNWIKATPSYKWIDFANLLKKSGFNVSTDSPGHGSIITFGANNEMIILKSDLSSPEEFLFYVKGKLFEKHWKRIFERPPLSRKVVVTF